MRRAGRLALAAGVLVHALCAGGLLRAAGDNNDGAAEVAAWTQDCPPDCLCTATSLRCDGASLPLIQRALNAAGALLADVRLVDVSFEGDLLDPAVFGNASGLRRLALVDCDLETVKPIGNHTSVNERLRSVDLTDNDIESYSILSQLGQWWPSVTDVTLDRNDIASLSAHSSLHTLGITTLSVRRCELDQLPAALPANLRRLDAGGNEIESIQGQRWPQGLAHLDLSDNRLTELGNDSLHWEALPMLKTLRLDGNTIAYIHSGGFGRFASLTHLNLSGNPIADPLIITPRSLRHYGLARTNIRYFNVTHLAGHSPALREADISHNADLVAIVGRLAGFYGLERLRANNCSVRSLANDFFTGARGRPIVDIAGNAWRCGCALQWAIGRPELVDVAALANGDQGHCLEGNRTETGNTTAEERLAEQIRRLDAATGQCAAIGIAWPPSNGTITRHLYTSDTLVHCDAYHTGGGGSVAPSIEWRRHSPALKLGKWTPDGKGGHVVNYDNDPFEDGKFEVLPGGALLIRSFSTYDVERYYCTVRSAGSENNSSLTLLIRVRQSLAKWQEIEIVSYFAGAITTMVFFALYMVWSALRKFIMWRLNEMEQSSRMQNMLEALEKYRTRQMEVLQEKYVQSVQTVRDQYTQQVEQVQRSYTVRASRLRDYRDTGMEQLAAVKESYNAQMLRVREYGSNRMERLWDSYERQMNRIRTFSLQSRLRLQRQHQIKQRYLKKLYANLDAYWSGPAGLEKDIAELPESSVDDLPLPFLSPALHANGLGANGLQCIAEESPDGSFHSLPTAADPPLPADSPVPPGTPTGEPALTRRRRNSDEPVAAACSSTGGGGGDGSTPQRDDSIRGGGGSRFRRGHRRTESYELGGGSTRTPLTLGESARPLLVRYAPSAEADQQRAPLQTVHDETAL